jgi:subtilisin family serine protease
MQGVVIDTPDAFGLASGEGARRESVHVSEPWHVGAVWGLNLARVWAQAGKGDGIHVAILDSGVAETSGLPDERIAQFDPSGTGDARHDRTTTFHGTSVVSVLASDDDEALGVAPGVRCSCFNVYNSQQEPIESSVIVALARAVAMNVDLICCTFTFGSISDELREQLDAVQAARIPIVASAGDVFPDAASGVISVVVSTMFKTIVDRPIRSKTTIAAPGIKIPASTPAGVSPFSGTSAAAPVAAGAIALAIAYARKRRVEEWFRVVLGDLLISTGNRATEPPLIDICGLLQAIDDQTKIS